MASFYSVFGFLYVNNSDDCEEDRFDVIGSLPLEVAQDILRSLPAKDLLSAVSVCRKWMEICKSDIRLRKRVRRHLRKMRKDRFLNIIRDDFGFGSRREADRPEHRIAMSNSSNLHSRSGPHIGNNNFDRAGRSQIRYAPYLKGSSGRQARLSKNVIANEGGSRRIRI